MRAFEIPVLLVDEELSMFCPLGGPCLWRQPALGLDEKQVAVAVAEHFLADHGVSWPDLTRCAFRLERVPVATSRIVGAVVATQRPVPVLQAGGV